MGRFQIKAGDLIANWYAYVMAISFNNKTKATSQSEKLFIQAGGYSPEQTLSRGELSDALQATVNQLADRKSPLLVKLYKQCVDSGHLQRDHEIDALADAID